MHQCAGGVRCINVLGELGGWGVSAFKAGGS